MTNANIVTIAGRPHDIRCPQSGRTDVDDCCKPMVAYTATMEERERCAKIVEDMGPTPCCGTAVLEVIAKKIRRPREKI